MKLSIVIPCFNAASTLAAQLESLCRQGDPVSWEVVIADNGSTDSTVTIARQFEHRLPHFRIVVAGDLPGAAHARNMGIAAATGEWLAFCDADDEMADGWLLGIAGALSNHHLVAGSLEYQKLNEPWLVSIHTRFQEHDIDYLFDHPDLPYARSANLAFSRSLFDAVGPWDTTLRRGEDVDYCIRASRAGYRLQFVPDAVMHYRLRPDLRALYRQAVDTGENGVLVWRRYGNGNPARLARLKSIIWLLLYLCNAPQHIGSKRELAKWVMEWGWRLGQARGNFKYR